MINLNQPPICPNCGEADVERIFDAEDHANRVHCGYCRNSDHLPADWTLRDQFADHPLSKVLLTAYEEQAAELVHYKQVVEALTSAAGFVETMRAKDGALLVRSRIFGALISALATDLKRANPPNYLPWEVTTQQDGEPVRVLIAAIQPGGQSPTERVESLKAELAAAREALRGQIPELLTYLSRQAARGCNAAHGGVVATTVWAHDRAGPVEAECTACGEVRMCAPQGAAGYPLCLACYQQAVLDAGGAP